MTILATPNVATYTVVSPADLITATCASGDHIRFTWVGPAGVTGQRTVRDTTEQVGPWPVGTLVTITATRGSPDWAVSTTGGGSATALGTDKTVAASDDGKTYLCTAALTATFPASLSPKPSVILVPPASGNLSIAFSGGATGNGATSTITRTRANNPVGVAVVAYPETDAYGVGGQ